MPITKKEALDKFCIATEYDKYKLQDETRQQYLARRQKEWSMDVVRSFVHNERRKESEAQAELDVKNFDI